ncbi:hypothetical protein ABD91_26065 [Lysinibacillus sphaericus]|uniref:hypothetical protein n=1 Tax=Lysinibacillus sphaericus TaxID=1421 RepID=UPI0018CEB17F|nr:hypothetical protein [Lysinibacillus sphaericus]MBG9694199.1 hypothetical protein [Lysinibacillus sphaericus]
MKNEFMHSLTEETWELLEKLSSEQLIERFKMINGVFGKSYFLHKSGNLYYADKACTVNKDGRSWLGMSYYPVTKEGKIVHDIPHTRVMDEFASYRFVPINTLYDSFAEIFETVKHLANYTMYAMKSLHGTWSYSFLPFNEEDFKGMDVEFHTICVEEFLIINTTINAETEGQSFDETYRGVKDIGEYDPNASK